MRNSVPLLALTFFAIVIHSQAQVTAPKAHRQVVTPGGAQNHTDISVKGVSVPATTAFVRVLHAVPGGAQFDVFAGSRKVASGRGFSGITSYYPLRIGKNAFKVFNAGTTSPLIVGDSFTLARGSYYTVAIYGKKAPQLIAINESKGKENLEKARVRVVHLAPGAPELLITTPSTRNDLGYAKLISKPLEYGKSGSKLVLPKTTTIQIRTQDRLLKETPAIKFEAGKRLSAFVIGDVNSKDKSALDIIVKLAAE